MCVCRGGGGGGGEGGSALPVNVLVEKKRFSRSVNYQNLVYFSHALFSLCESSLDLSFPRPDEEVMVSTQSNGATLRTEAQQRQDESSMTYHGRQFSKNGMLLRLRRITTRKDIYVKDVPQNAHVHMRLFINGFYKHLCCHFSVLLLGVHNKSADD